MRSVLPITLDVSSKVVSKDFTTDLTIVVAHRGSAMGLWMTIESSEAQLRDSGLKYNYVVVHNGDAKLDLEAASIRTHLSGSGKMQDWIHHASPLSPPGARQLGSESADGKYIFFFDNHCIAAPNYFKSAIHTFESTGADMVHSLTRFFTGEKDHLHYNLSLEKNFWAASECDEVRNAPYRIAAAGHGGFAVRRSVWEELGGYGPITLLRGYAGEEMLWDLKAAMHDKTNWLDPHMIHHHWSGIRPYDRHYSDDYFINSMLVAYVIGGDKWVNTVYKTFKHHPKAGKTPMYKLYEQAICRGHQEMLKLQRTRLRDLDEQLEEFSRLGIPF